MTKREYSEIEQIISSIEYELAAKDIDMFISAPAPMQGKSNLYKIDLTYTAYSRFKIGEKRIYLKREQLNEEGIRSKIFSDVAGYILKS